MQLTELASVPFVLAIVELCKQYGLPSQYAPIAALVLGTAASLLVSGLTVESGIQGVIIGLTASGLYSGIKATVISKPPIK